MRIEWRFRTGDQRESKRRGGQVFFSSWRPKRIEGEDRTSLIAGDQRESKRRGGQVFFSSWRPKRIKKEGRTVLLK
jgi:hypothetical protein